MKHSILFALVLALSTFIAEAQPGPGWRQATAVSKIKQAVKPQIALAPALVRSRNAKLAAVSGPNDADYITPEIQALSDGLMREPTLIYDYVHNRIRYTHYFGVKKGAHLTLLEGSGNDFDQCALLVALLRAAGFEASYQCGMRLATYSDPSNQDIKHWIGLTASDPIEAYDGGNYLPSLFTRAGFVNVGGTPLWSFGSNTFSWLRVWVRLTKNGVPYYLDPAFKQSVQIPGIDLTTATGLSKASILASSGAAGQAGHPEYAQNLVESALATHLTSATANLVSAIQTQKPNAYPDEIVGGWRVQETQTTTLNSTQFATVEAWSGVSPPASYSLPLQTWTFIPDVFFDRVKISTGTTGNALNATYTFAALRGRRLSMLFSGTQPAQAQLWVDDGKLDGTPGLPDSVQSDGSGATANVTVTINVAKGSWNFTTQNFADTTATDQLESKFYLRTARYALIYGFEPSPDYLRARQKVLDTYKVQGIPDTDWRVQTEVLNVIGLNWLLQTELSSRLLKEQQAVFAFPHYRVGRVAQEGSFYIDVGLDYRCVIGRNGFNATTTKAGQIYFDVGTYFDSAMEHGVLEQMQGGAAASTIKLIQRANSSGQKIFQATTANWNSGANIYSQLSKEPADMAEGWPIALIPTPPTGGSLLIPQKGKIGLGVGTWKGNGHFSQGGTFVLAIINTVQFGGYNSVLGAVSSDPLINLLLNSSFYVNSVPITTIPTIGGDPVDLASGAFTLASTDLAVGQAEPRGFSFFRRYNSATVTKNSALLGFGWTHNYDVTATETSDIQAGLGLATPQAMAAFLTATRAALLTYDSAVGTAPEWVTTALATKWGVDQLLKNAVNVSLGGDFVQFIKQPYLVAGALAYSPGAGLTHSLAKDASGNYQLKERNGRTFQFNANKQLVQISDLFGKSLNLTYESYIVSSVTKYRVKTVTDCWGASQRTMTLNYDANNRLSNVTDNTMSPARTVVFGYNATGQLVSATDPESKIWTYDYVSSTDHHIFRAKDAFAAPRVVVENTYDAQGRVSQQLNEGVAARQWKYHYGGYVTIEEKPVVSPAPVGELTYHYFDQRTRNVGTKDGLGNRSTLVYDGQDHVVSQTTPKGETTTILYDGNQNVLKITDPLALFITRAYDAQNRLWTETDKRGKTTTFTYDSAVRPLITQIVSPFGISQTVTRLMAYNSDGTLLNSTDPDGKVTSYLYDTRGNLSQLTLPAIAGQLAAIFAKTYTVAGDLLTSTDAQNVVTQFEYNKRRQLTKTTVVRTGGNLVSQYIYDNNGLLSETIDPRGFHRYKSYTADGRLITAREPDLGGTVTTFTSNYDVRNYLSSTVNPALETVGFSYDNAGRLATQKDPLLRTTQFGYDANGQTIQVTSPLTTALQRIQFGYNSRGERTSMTDATGFSVNYTFDNNGNPFTALNRQSGTFSSTYFDDNRVKTSVTPSGKTTAFAYNQRGLPVTLTEPSLQQATLSYDDRGRLISRGDLVATSTYTYDRNGNTLTHAENGITQTRVYDELNRVTSYNDGMGNTLGYHYDSNGNLDILTYPDAKTVTYAYDSHNRLTTVTDWASRVTTYGYDLADRVTSITRPNGTVRTVTYNVAGETLKITETAPGSLPIALFNLGYDTAGRISAEFIAPIPIPFTETAQTITYDADNRIATFNGTAVVHDADGNMTSGPLNNNTAIAHTFDARNRLTAVAVSGSAPALSYTYNAEGHRTGITKAGQTTTFASNPAGLSQVLVRTKPDGTKTFYVYGLGLIYESDPTVNTRTYHYDYRGSTVALSDQNGVVKDRVEYSTYGRVTRRIGTTDTPFLYNGRYGVMTDANGLVYMRARYYNPTIRRFINADPSGFSGGMNWYAYADGNPISLVDPFGLAAIGDSAMPYWQDGLLTTAGFAGAIANGLEGLFQAGRQAFGHPLDTLSAIGNGLQQPVNTSTAAFMNRVGQTFSDTLSADPLDRGMAAGNITFVAASVLAPVGRVGGVAERVAGAESAQNVMNGVRLRQQLTLESANSAFSADGTLSQGAINNSRQIIPAGSLINTAIPNGFAKYSTQTYQSPSGEFQLHFYRNPSTGEPFLGLDYKSVFNGPPKKP